MAAAKMETAAERYRRIKEERLANVELFDFTSPSGMVWKLRKVELAQFITSGVMPMGLAGKLAKGFEGPNAEEAFTSLDFADQERTVNFIRAVVRFCCVEPRIVDTPTEPHHIRFEEVEPDDFNAIFVWAVPGGDGAEALNTFRGE